MRSRRRAFPEEIHIMNTSKIFLLNNCILLAYLLLNISLIFFDGIDFYRKGKGSTCLSLLVFIYVESIVVFVELL